MKITITRNDLYAMDQEMQNLKKNSPGLAVLLHAPMKKFYAQNSMQLSVMKSRFDDIRKKFVQQDEAGNYLTEEKEGKRIYKFITSKLDLENARVLDVSLVEQKFNQECEALMKQEINIEI